MASGDEHTEERESNIRLKQSLFASSRFGKLLSGLLLSFCALFRMVLAVLLCLSGRTARNAGFAIRPQLVHVVLSLIRSDCMHSCMCPTFKPRKALRVCVELGTGHSRRCPRSCMRSYAVVIERRSLGPWDQRTLIRETKVTTAADADLESDLLHSITMFSNVVYTKLEPVSRH